MLEESLPAIWASMYSWFTPTVLFVLLNIVIGTIVYSSSLGSPSHPHDDKHGPGVGAGHNLVRTGSVLHRLKSVNLNLFRQKTEDMPAITAFLDPDPTPAPQPQVHFVEGQHAVAPAAEFHEAAEEHHFGRSASDTHPMAGEKPGKLAEKLKKSASSKSAFDHFKEEEVTGVRRPATTRAERVALREDEEVDAKADDFINRFRNQLKLQRLDSIIRYKEMLNRGKE